MINPLGRGLRCALLGTFFALVAGCGGGGGGNTGGGNTGGGGTDNGGLPAPGTTPFVNSFVTRSACAANAHVAERARWTVLVYMNAASDLQPDSLFNVAQIASVGSNSDVNVVVQWKQATDCKFFSGISGCGNPSFVGTRRYYILPHSQADVNAIGKADTSSLENPIERLADPATNVNGTSDMGDYRALNDFVKWGSAAYPSDHLAVVVWDHGSGALNTDNRAAKRLKAKLSRGVSHDKNTGNQISTEQIPLGLAGANRTIDALIIDCSLEATTEVAYESRNAARVMIASEESPPGNGYPYDTWLTDLKANAAVGPCDMGNKLIQDTIANYPGTQNTNITQTMIDLSKMSAVAQALNAFGAALAPQANTLSNLIYLTRTTAQYYEFAEYKDLYDFAYLVRNATGATSDMKQTALNVQSALQGASGAILASSHGVAGQAGSSGLTIYLPGPNTSSSTDSSIGYDPQYNGLALAKDAPNWPLFLQAQVK